MNTPTIYTATPADLSPPLQTDSLCVDLVLATDYQKLKDEFKQLTAENVALKQAESNLVRNIINDLGDTEFKYARVQTPTTDLFITSLSMESNK